jgi:hypothetical protein
VSRSIILVLFLLPCSVADGQELRITSPVNDTILLSDKVKFMGAATGGGARKAAQVILTVGGKEYKIDVTPAGKWAIADVELPKGTRECVAKWNGQTAKILLTKGKGLVNRGEQKVWFDWTPEANKQIINIAKGTIEPLLNKAEEKAFLDTVQTQTVMAFSRAYADFNVEVVGANGPAVHTVRMLGNAGDIFGQSVYDCGNQVPKQTSEIWVGTYRATMVDDLNRKGGPIEWEPMKKTDSWQLRAADIGEALGRTSAHETGHSLGLVGDGGPGVACGWMRGCDGGHNCDEVNNEFPGLAQRFDLGWYIMDPGGKTLNNARLAEPSPNGRSATRRPAVFNPFNRSYLSLVHPH